MEIKKIAYDIEGSLNYAEFLQKALFPKQRHFKRIFSESFVVFKPLHYVSGDFYWLTEIDGLKYIVVGDCAGHGVPGAILSVLMYSLFDYVVLNKRVKKTHKILKEIDKRFTESFSSVDAQKPFDNDWIDISICCIDTNSNTLHFSGCRRDMLFVSDSSPMLIRGGKHPIGGWKYNLNGNFISERVHYKLGDSIYIGTDGFQDQIGGARCKKYNRTKLHDYILSISNLPMAQQKELLEKELSDWIGDNCQTDDICIVGIRL